MQKNLVGRMRQYEASQKKAFETLLLKSLAKMQQSLYRIEQIVVPEPKEIAVCMVREVIPQGVTTWCGQWTPDNEYVTRVPASVTCLRCKAELDKDTFPSVKASASSSEKRALIHLQRGRGTWCGLVRSLKKKEIFIELVTCRTCLLELAEVAREPTSTEVQKRLAELDGPPATKSE